MTQLSIDDIEPTRLVPKNYMPTIHWRIYDELTDFHLGKEQAIKAVDLAELAGIDTRTLREVIDSLRSKQYAKIIGDNNGYYIGTTEEFNEWYYSRLKRTISSILTTLNLNPNKINVIYKVLTEYKRNGLAQGQLKMPLTGYEEEFVRQFAEDYKKGDIEEKY